MSWFTNLFTSNKTARNSRNTMSSTHEAFSLPTSSPRTPADAYHPSTPSTPEPHSVADSTYSYPPSSPNGAYDYVPAATGSRTSRKSTLLPLHSQGPGMGGGAPFPPLAQTWARLRQWLANEYPELGDTLNYGILPQDLAQIELAFGSALPQSIRDSYLCADGQEAESSVGCAEGLFYGLTLLPLEDVLEEWRFWREVDGDPNTGANARLKEQMESIPPGWVRKEYSSRGWIPLVADKAGNYLGVDMNPGEKGQAGQVIVFGRDFDTKVVMYRGQGTHGWAQWLAGFVDDLEAGECFELGTTNDASEGSEDSVGYESYFFDGVGRGLGDGGGDTGTGGMRLTGEYRGWNVLEAWADKSLRKWQELGLVSAMEPSSSKGKATAHLPTETLKAVSNVTSAAEVPIPVLVDSSKPSTSGPLANVTNRDSMPHRQPLPTIAVTKPPAPMPVGLPTPDDIHVALESSSSQRTRFDIEAGGDMMMRELPSPTSPTSISSTRPTVKSVSSTSTVRQHTATESIPAPIPPPPTSPTSAYASPIRTAPTSPKPPVAAPHVVDLLADNTPALTTVPLTAVSPDPTPSVQSDDSPVLIGAEDAPRPPSLDINHIGGSSTSEEESSSNDGVLVSSPELDNSDDIPDASDTTPEKSLKHEKTDSVSSQMDKVDLSGESKGKTDSDSNTQTPSA